MPKEFVSVLIPTYNEAETIEETLSRTIEALGKTSHDFEILVIDDSSADNTAAIAQKSLAGFGRVIVRKEQRSLSLSVLEGIKQAAGNIIIVMDADGSHPAELIPQFIEESGKGNDLIIASRYIKGGKTKDFPLSRRFFSRFACLVGRLVTDVKDNTSGYFSIRKSALEQANLTPRGFKIGLEIFVKAKSARLKEIPYTFVNRRKGKSKFSVIPLTQYALQIFSLLIYRLRNKKKCL